MQTPNTLLNRLNITSFLTPLLTFLLFLTLPASGQDLIINDALIVGMDADPNGQNWNYTDEEIWIGSGSGETGSLLVPGGQQVQYYDLRLGQGHASATGSLTIDGSNAEVISSRDQISIGSRVWVGDDGVWAFGLAVVRQGAGAVFC